MKSRLIFIIKLITSGKPIQERHPPGKNLLKSFENKGGFVSAFWDGTAETEIKIKDATKATIRCIPLDMDKQHGKCVFSGKPSELKVIFARAY